MMNKMEKVNKIILHCSASDVVRDDSFDRIKHLHTAPPDTTLLWKSSKVAGRGFSDIGYHFVITKDGVLHQGRSVSLQGAHSYGQNHDSIGICLSGNTKFSLKQLKVLFELLDTLKQDYGLTDDDVFGHYYFDKKGKTCPNLIC